MTEREEQEEATLSEAELDADRPSALLASSLSEAKAERMPERDWDAASDALFARLEREKATTRRSERSRVVWISFAGALAAAAAAVFYLRNPSPPANPPVAVHDSAVGSLVSANGAAVTVSGTKVSDGYALKGGDVIAVSGGNAVFSQEGKVRFSIENGSEVSVTHPSAPLILALAIGATEADVTPVPTGDAFAVDVAAKSGAVARVAVHGTHLRVARQGDHVVVDLTEGVVAIGGASGGESTIVHAPAHVEFDATDAAHTVVINRAADAVRAADTTVHQASAAAPPSTVAAVHPATHTSPGAVTAVKPVDTATPAAIVDPERALSQAVQSCIVSVPSSTQVSLTFESKLSLRLADDGTVQSALFDPPLPVEARECAARAIYQKGLFSHPGDVTIPITVRR